MSAQREHQLPGAQREHELPGAQRAPCAGHQRGMTLLEMLVALSIFAIVGGSLYPVIGGALASRRQATDRVMLDAEARMILDRLEQDIVANCESGFQGAYPPRFLAPAPPSRYTAAQRNVLEATTLVARGVTTADAFVAGEDVAALAADRGDLVHILWSIDRDGRLRRQELRPPRPQPIDWSRVPAEVVSERAAVTLEFYEPETWVEGWDSSPSGAQRGRAPVAVRTSLELAGDDATVELVSTVVLPVVESSGDLRRSAGSNR